MYDLEGLNGFKKLGYIIQLPTGKAKEYFMVKQFDGYSKRIYIRVGKVSATVEVICKKPLDNTEKKLLDKLIFEDLNLKAYKII